MPVATLLTDFGTRDYYVAAVKGVLLRLAPGATLVDISHDVAPGDVEEAAFLLGAAAPFFPAGTVHLAVVDPGVGSERRILAAESSAGFLVGPDNGLFTRLLEGATVHAVARTDLFLDAPGATFHGRDRFAPVAAWLLRGEPLRQLGPEIGDPARLALAQPRREAAGLSGRVAHVDRFGNLVTDIPCAWYDGRPFTARVGGATVTRWVRHYEELPPGEPGLLCGSLATLELSLRGDSLARCSGAGRGNNVTIQFP